MARLLEDLPAGTRVFDDDHSPVGEVRAVYGSGEGRLAEFVLVHWSKRGEAALVPADDVTAIEDDGVILVHKEGAYDGLAAFDPSANPSLHRL
ncbi:MAG TPA: hypothetical protein VFE17_01020 [Candidatus Baltobacteraceae bacterium]|jgi:hypothetical protein|nr:hypothetical protein [Candidatus Baltobacteraceae bacterium]